jgi:hypothetical protein
MTSIEKSRAVKKIAACRAICHCAVCDGFARGGPRPDALVLDVRDTGAGRRIAACASILRPLGVTVARLEFMSRPEEYFLVFANTDYTLDLSRFLRTESTDGWHFFQGKENVGTMLIVKSGDLHYVHASFTRELDGEKITNYVRSLLWSLNVHNALVTVHSGKQVAHFDYEF